MKRMLFNATQAEELRVAIVDGQKLIDLDIESANKEERKSNIYKGVISRIEPSLEAAFVDYGSARPGFLPFKEISRTYFKPGADARSGIREVLREGQELIVQVEKDERGAKGAALTTYISLAGRYLVLMPNNPRGGGVSRRIEGEERTELREAMDQLEVPQGMSLIARTAAIDRSAEELQWDLNYLFQLWTAIESAAREQNGAFLIYQEGSLVIRTIRDYFQPDIGEILIDTDDIYEQAYHFMRCVMPANVGRIKRYSDDVPLFSRFQIEHQIESAYSRQVSLPSGGAVVIDHTEALVAVDVNSGRATKGADIEDTALRTNLEAAEEVARQLRLRDLGGLIVIDFIDMESSRNQHEVENRLRQALRYDRARVQTGKISRFGLLELSRQRLRPALAETSYITCPRCTGTGHIRSTESSALHILRILEEEAMKENTGAVQLQAPVDVATYLLNEKRVDIARVEFRHKIQLVIVPNRHMETPAYEIARLRHDQLNLDDAARVSYQLAVQPSEEAPASRNGEKAARQEAAVKNIPQRPPAPEPHTEDAAASPGIVSRFTHWLTGLIGSTRQEEPETAPAPAATVREPRARGERSERNGRNGDRNERGGERNDRGGERRNNRTQRGERSERDNARAEKSALSSGQDKAPRSPKSQGEQRGGNERQERQDRPDAAQQRANGDNGKGGGSRRRSNRDKAVEESSLTQQAPVVEAAAVPRAPDEQAALVDTPEKRRRRSRGGRRGRSSEGGATEVSDFAAADALDEGDDLPVTAGLPFDAPPPVAQTVFPDELPVAVNESFVAEEPAPVARKRENAEPVPVFMPSLKETDSFSVAPAFIPETPVLVVEPKPAPIRNPEPPAVPARTADLFGSLEEAGLVMIETSSEKPHFSSGAVEEPVRRGRKPRSAPLVVEEPLQQVETHKED